MKSKLFFCSLLLIMTALSPLHAQKGNALYFNSNSSRVAIPHHPDLNFAKDFTIEAWIFPLSHPSSINTILEKVDNIWGLYLTQSGLANAWTTSGSNNFADVTSVVNVNNYEWTHIASTYEYKSGITRLFVNGRSQNIFKFPGNSPIATSNDSLIIGGATSASRRFYGYIDEVRLSKIIRYQFDEDPRQTWQIDTNTIGLYHFDEGSGTVGVDASGRNHPAFLTNVSFAALPITGIKDQTVPPDKIVLIQNYPNPFTTSSMIEIVGSEHTKDAITFKVYDLLGREVLNLSNQLAQGKSSVIIVGEMLPKSGTYIYRLQVGDHTLSRTMTFLK